MDGLKEYIAFMDRFHLDSFSDKEAREYLKSGSLLFLLCEDKIACKYVRVRREGSETILERSRKTLEKSLSKIGLSPLRKGISSIIAEYEGKKKLLPSVVCKILLEEKIDVDRVKSLLEKNEYMVPFPSEKSELRRAWENLVKEELEGTSLVKGLLNPSSVNAVVRRRFLFKDKPILFFTDYRFQIEKEGYIDPEARAINLIGDYLHQTKA